MRDKCKEITEICDKAVLLAQLPAVDTDDFHLKIIAENCAKTFRLAAEKADEASLYTLDEAAAIVYEMSAPRMGYAMSRSAQSAFFALQGAANRLI